MANANPSRPGVNPTAGKLEINIPKEMKFVKKDNGNVVRRTEFVTGTIRETNVFHGDHKDAKPLPRVSGTTASPTKGDE